MDGTLAVIYLLASLTDMGMNHCRAEGCLARSEATSRFSAQMSDVHFQADSIGSEIYLGYDLGRRFGPYQPTLGVSTTSDGASWIGFGIKSTYGLGSGGFFAEGSLMPGLYNDAGGPDLGGSLQFRSALGIGYAFDNGATLSVLYDHRSNADTDPLNPGLETLAIRLAIALD